MKTRLRLFAAATVALLLGCGSDDVTAPEQLQGNYKLERVNGAALPAVVEQTATTKLEITAGTLSLAANGTYSGSLTGVQTVGTTSVTATRTSTGTFTVAGTQLTLTETATGASYSGTINGNRLTAVLEGVTFEFVKQ